MLRTGKNLKCKSRKEVIHWNGQMREVLIESYKMFFFNLKQIWTYCCISYWPNSFFVKIWEGGVIDKVKIKEIQSLPGFLNSHLFWFNVKKIKATSTTSIVLNTAPRDLWLFLLAKILDWMVRSMTVFKSEIDGVALKWDSPPKKSPTNTQHPTRPPPQKKTLPSAKLT